MNITPKTYLGQWSAGLFIIFLLLLSTGMFVVQVLGQTGGDTIFDNLWISIPMLGALASAIIAFILGTISIITKKERSIFVFIATTIGLLVLIFALGEILFPH